MVGNPYWLFIKHMVSMRGAERKDGMNWVERAAAYLHLTYEMASATPTVAGDRRRGPRSRGTAAAEAARPAAGRNKFM